MVLNLRGQKFGRLTAIHPTDGRDKIRNIKWLCRCDCGTELLVTAVSLAQRNTASCGCYQTENRAEIGKANRKHGLWDSPEHRAWRNLRERCNNKKSIKYPDYGGRGIKVCERWNSFESFLADVGPRPTSLHSLDRSDNNGNYEPGNCTWATKKEQANNRRPRRPSFIYSSVTA